MLSGEEFDQLREDLGRQYHPRLGRTPSPGGGESGGRLTAPPLDDSHVGRRPSELGRRSLSIS